MQYSSEMGLFSLSKTRERIPAKRKLMKEDKLLARNIKRLRKSRGMTQGELSDLLAMNELYIAQIEAGQQGLSLQVIYRIAKVFNVPLKDLFSFESI